MTEGDKRVGVMGTGNLVDRDANALLVHPPDGTRACPALGGDAAEHGSHEGEPGGVKRPEALQPHDVIRRTQRHGKP